MKKTERKLIVASGAASYEENKKGRVCVSVLMDTALHRRLKVEAARRGVGLFDVMSNALLKYLPKEA